MLRSARAPDPSSRTAPPSERGSERHARQRTKTDQTKNWASHISGPARKLAPLIQSQKKKLPPGSICNVIKDYPDHKSPDPPTTWIEKPWNKITTSKNNTSYQFHKLLYVENLLPIHPPHIPILPQFHTLKTCYTYPPPTKRDLGKKIYMEQK